MNSALERATVISSLIAAFESLLGLPLNPRLIPPDGASFGYALRGARDSSGVAVVRINNPGDRLLKASPGTCTFGTDEPTVRAILTVMKFNPLMRSAAVLQYSDRALTVLEDDLFLECASFTTGSAERGISTMDWGIAFCCKEDVPDAIYEKSPDVARSRLVIFGEDPADVANNIIICSGRI